MALGDSKSAPDSNTWGIILANRASASTSYAYRALELGRGGYDIAKMLNNVTVNHDGSQFVDAIIPDAISKCEQSFSGLDKCVLGLHENDPAVGLIDIGVNDVGFNPPWGTPTQATWQSNYIAVLDALHAQWPSTQWYLTIPWKRQPGGDETIFDTLAGYVANVVAARSSFAHTGDDERAWFKPLCAAAACVHFDDVPAGVQAASDARRVVLGF